MPAEGGLATGVQYMFASDLLGVPSEDFATPRRVLGKGKIKKGKLSHPAQIVTSRGQPVSVMAMYDTCATICAVKRSSRAILQGRAAKFAMKNLYWQQDREMAALMSQGGRPQVRTVNGLREHREFAPTRLRFANVGDIYVLSMVVEDDAFTGAELLLDADTVLLSGVDVSRLLRHRKKANKRRRLEEAKPKAMEDHWEEEYADSSVCDEQREEAGLCKRAQMILAQGRQAGNKAGEMEYSPFSEVYLSEAECRRSLEANPLLFDFVSWSLRDVEIYEGLTVGQRERLKALLRR